ncbi:MAG: hypothetical protein QJR07_15645 [Acetobacteraceae bacterium]|nr:hypothetical protein [Acetobacteraceae bacterium]
MSGADVKATSSGLTLDALAGVPRWVAWQTQDRKGKPSKVPYAPGGGLAKADTPATWGMRAQAEARAAALPRPYGAGGIGIMLGDHAGLALGGIDLDTCRDPATGTLEPWAAEVVERFGSYAEVSPSGTGVKVFFSFDGAELPALRQAMRSEHGRQFKRKADSDHPPAIEFYLGNRYFAVTGQQLDGSPAELRRVSTGTLLWLIHEAGPAFADDGHKPEAAPEGAGEAPPRRQVGAGRDRSRSAAAFRLAAQEKRRGATYEQMKAALLADPETAAWTREKGLAASERELRRIWDRATARHGRGGENRPTIGALLLAGEQVVAIDNCEAPLGGEFLCQMLTQPVVRARILGRSEAPELPSNAFVTATGNNLALIGDMTRRALLCRLDPKCERPELRRFSRNPVEAVKADRGRYVAAALTVLRAFHVAGRPKQSDPLGSFEAWSRWVRDALLWLDEADPVQTMEEARALDPKLDALNAVVAQWRQVIGTERVSVRDIIDRATQTHTPEGKPFGPPPKPEFTHPDFREALLTVAGEGGAINSRRLGKWLLAHQDRVVSGCRIVRRGLSGGILMWQVEAEGQTLADAA